MKRYLICNFAFDSRAMLLCIDAKDDWDEKTRNTWKEDNQRFIVELGQTYGSFGLDTKVANVKALGVEPFSVVSFHSKFLRQCRDAFIVGSYYPALTGACALGERILNHLIRRLKAYYKGTPGFKKVCRQESIDNWDVMIDVLSEWGVFLDEEAFRYWKAFAIYKAKQFGRVTDLEKSKGVADSFKDLGKLRHKAIHFRPELDEQAREPALSAIRLLQDIIAAQFGCEGPLPWFIPGTPGKLFIKRNLESNPFIREFYLPMSVLVGPEYRWIPMEGMTGLRLNDPGPYEDRIISDEEFVTLMRASRDELL